MNLYGGDLSFFDINYSTDFPIINSLSYPKNAFEDDDESGKFTQRRNQSPPKYRHDGKSPLPLGMDWSPPPRKWDGKNSIWPHEHSTGWSYCVAIPSWVVSSNSKGSDSVVFYRVQIGIQSPEGITTTREILRRFNDFLELFYDLKKAFPKKNVPSAPPKRIINMSSRTALEERRHALEEWMEKLLSDIDLSRSAPVAIFLELEAAARSSFLEINEQDSDTDPNNNVAAKYLLQPKSDVIVGDSSTALDHDNASTGEIGTSSYRKDDNELHIESSSSKQEITDESEKVVEPSTSSGQFLEQNHAIHLQGDSEFMGKYKSSENDRPDCHVEELSQETTASDVLGHLRTVLPTDEQQKLDRLLMTAQQRLLTAKADMEDIISRLNQETAARNYLSTKVDSTATNSQVKDLEVELETTKENCKENLQHANVVERERYTHMQWDMEELRKKCLELEVQVKSEQEERLHAEAEKKATIQRNKVLVQELDAAREQLEKLRKERKDEEVKSKADMKLLVQEVRSLRSSQLQLKQELNQVMEEKLEVERVLEKEKHNMEIANTANAKLLHECEILHKRLQECSVNFLIDDEDKLTLDASPSETIDLVKTSDNRIGLILAEAQLLAQDVENITTSDSADNGPKRTDDELRKMLTDIFIDNARMRKQINSIIHYALTKVNL